jgi:ABC-type multidrug transport system fused ATPase/permease subunit
MATVIQESLGGAKVILGFGNQEKSVEALRRAFDAHRRATVKSQTLRQAIPQLYYPLGLIVVAVALSLARALKMPMSETAVLLYALLRLTPTVGSLLGFKNSLDNFAPSYEQLAALRRRAQAHEQRTGVKPFQGFEREIVIEHVSFAHPGRGPALRDVTIRVPKGAMVGIVGESGSGKSTLVDVIMGFNEPASGQVTVDGTPLRELDITSYRRRIGYVPQESVLFNMSIRENLRWANEQAGEEELAQACRLANAEEFIRQFPEGIDMLVGDRGVCLSGGQVQRLALARAVLRAPELLILDEATSALDTHSERLIQEAIETIARETTVIVIAHRLSTIARADYIYLLEDGRIVEEGTYDALIGMRGRFCRMAEAQMLEPRAADEAALDAGPAGVSGAGRT